MNKLFQKLKYYFNVRKCRKAMSRFEHWLDYDDDILTETEKNKLAECVGHGRKIIETADCEAMKLYVKNADENIAAILDRPKMWLREILDILAVALAVAFGIRALFFQPFKIPTGSMQPTLFGIHYIEKNPAGNKFLGQFGSFFDSVLFSCERAYLKLETDGMIEEYAPRNSFFSAKTELTFGGRKYILPGTIQKIAEYAKLEPNKIYKKGTVLCDGYLSSGDHLFVDRLSHYLCGLKRGDIVVFTTENIEMDGEPLAKSSGFYYVKRLVGMPGDTLKIKDETLFVREKNSNEFRPVAEFSDKFKKVYSRKGGYQGHSSIAGYAPGKYLDSPFSEFTVPEDSYFMLGDNTKFSADSRMWGVVPRRNIVGKPIIIFWPFSRRWGIPDRCAPLDMPTTQAEFNTFKEMYQQ